ncbi:TadE family type IV pilus minor pilin [Micromonospora sp. C31]|uniref:TadE family type IV pilus minor pilin n=1 Tax=Micromonospora sp. C31 TaxID=2824876 RepID=UPI0027DCB090|nr:TadE family type IV pilus minor pilin [Micromonospora sp. C31]
MIRRRPAGRDRGSFTAELAAGLPALLLLLLAGLSAVNAVGTKAGCLHAAREAALAASRGADGAAAASRAAPPGAEVTVTVDGQRVVATVRAPVRALGSRLPRISVTATAVAATEPGVMEPGVAEQGVAQPGAAEPPTPTVEPWEDGP